MKMSLFTFILFGLALFCPDVLPSQRLVRHPGILPEDETYRRLESIADIRSSENLPAAVSLKSLCPAPRDQRDRPMGAVYALITAFSIRVAAVCESLKGHPTMRVFSAAYLYNQLHEGADCGQGSYLSRGLQLLKNQGVCLESTFPSDDTDCHLMPGPEARKEAMRYRAAAYYRIFDLDAAGEQKLLAVKNALAAKSPVVVVLQVDDAFQALPAGQGHWTPGGARPFNQALVVVGYDDKAKTVELLNSYGTDWGNDGFVTIDYASFAKALRYGVEISTDRLLRCD